MKYAIVRNVKRQLSILLIFVLIITSCDNDDTLSTGNITVISSGVPDVHGTPIDQVNVGLFDISVLITEQFTSDDAISQKVFTNGQIKFNGLNPGNYVLVVMIQTGIRQTVQVTSDKTVTVDIFD